MDISRLKARCNQLKNDKKVELQLAKDRSLRYEKLQNNYDMVCKLHGDGNIPSNSAFTLFVKKSFIVMTCNELYIVFGKELENN